MTMTPHQRAVGRRLLTGRLMILALIGIGIAGFQFLTENVIDGSLMLSAATGPAKDALVRHTKDLHPFSHLASIPASSDPAKIKLEKVKLTRVFSREKIIVDPGFCKETKFGDPGGSAYCPYTEDESPAPAYEATYSFNGQPLASDEYGNRYFTFQVYFRPEELSPGLRKVLSIGKIGRSELTTYFKVTTSRPMVQKTVTDEATSILCGGSYVDGNWVQKDPNCKDQIKVKTVTAPSDYIVVKVDPVSARPQ
jgi:hypothetical protein